MTLDYEESLDAVQRLWDQFLQTDYAKLHRAYIDNLQESFGVGLQHKYKAVSDALIDEWKHHLVVRSRDWLYMDHGEVKYNEYLLKAMQTYFEEHPIKIIIIPDAQEPTDHTRGGTVPRTRNAKRKL
jgi:hypothetical protein